MSRRLNSSTAATGAALLFPSLLLSRAISIATVEQATGSLRPQIHRKPRYLLIDVLQRVQIDVRGAGNTVPCRT
jgi:hypothetical protein